MKRKERQRNKGFNIGFSGGKDPWRDGLESKNQNLKSTYRLGSYKAERGNRNRKEIEKFPLLSLHLAFVRSS